MKTMRLDIVSAEAALFSGEVRSSEVSGTLGELGILPARTTSSPRRRGRRNFERRSGATRRVTTRRRRGGVISTSSRCTPRGGIRARTVTSARSSRGRRRYFFARGARDKRRSVSARGSERRRRIGSSGMPRATRRCDSRCRVCFSTGASEARSPRRSFDTRPKPFGLRRPSV